MRKRLPNAEVTIFIDEALLMVCVAPPDGNIELIAPLSRIKNKVQPVVRLLCSLCDSLDRLVLSDVTLIKGYVYDPKKAALVKVAMELARSDINILSKIASESKGKEDLLRKLDAAAKVMKIKD